MSRGYEFENPTQTDGIPGDLSTPTTWNLAFETQRLANYNSILSKIDADMTYLLSLVSSTGTDTLSFSYASADAITVHAGLAIADDGTTHTVANDTTIDLDHDLDTGTRAANTIYFVWIGEDTTSGETTLLLSESGDTAPTSLVSASAYRLRNFFNTNEGNSNIEQFVDALDDALPSGMMMMWPAPYKPAGCHWAHGQTVSRTHAAYAGIFAVTGTLWGVGDGSTTFELIDMRGRSPLGAGQGSGLTLRTLGNSIGEESHTLTVGEMPIHTHDLHGWGDVNNVGYPTFLAGGSAGATFYRRTLENGGSDAHNTVHPCVVTNYIIKG